MFDLGFSGLERGGSKREIRATKASFPRSPDGRETSREGRHQASTPVSLISSGTHMSVSMTHRHPRNSRKQAAAAMTRTPTDMCVIHCVFFSVERETERQGESVGNSQRRIRFLSLSPTRGIPGISSDSRGRDIVAECVA